MQAQPASHGVREVVAKIWFHAQPLDDRILVRVRPLPPVKLGLVLGIGGEGLSSEGDVLAVGPGRWNKKRTNRIPMEIAVGERVLVKRGGPGAPISGMCIDERERLYMIRQGDVLGVLEDAAAAAA